MKYRAEIDGLRALAVLPVVFFHAGFDIFSGGFIGVDVFFVISGYLITTIIIQELQAGHFKLANFYDRRIRRIFPALALMTLVCIPVAWMCLPADAMEDFSLSLIGVATFSSNFVFWKQDGYFDTTAELTPLLHTWSLAVEEQYYILFPLAMMCFWRFRKRVIVILCLFVFLLSLGLAQWATLYAVRGGFYLLPPRGWELLIGAFCAFYLQWRVAEKGHDVNDIRAQQLLSMLGLAMIGWAVFCFDKLTPTPSLLTLVPTVGAALIILYANKGTWVNRILAIKPVVGIGLISYSTYLWHQPVFVFYRYNTLIEPSAFVMMGLSVISVALGWLSWRFVERPFRIKDFIPRRIVFSMAAAFCGLILFFGVQGYRSEGFPERSYVQLPENLEWTSLGDKIRSKGEPCDFQLIPGTRYVLACEFGDVNAKDMIVLYGDSHAKTMLDALDGTFKKNRIKGVQLDVYECENIPYVRQNGNLATTDCDQRYEEFLSYIKALSTDVIVVNRWTFRLFPLEGYDVAMPYKNSEGNAENESYREYAVYRNSELAYDAKTKETYLKLFIEKLAQASQTLYLVYPVPELAVDVSRANLLYRNRTGKILQDISVPYVDYQTRNAFVLSVFDTLEASNIERIKTAGIFCNSFIIGRCAAQHNSVPFYYDDDHLSDIGAQMVIDEIFKRRVAP